MKTIKFIYPRKIKPVTGGHRYEYSLRETLKASGLKVEYLSNLEKKGSLSAFNKLLSPLLALRFFNKVNREDDLVVFNSTTGLYFMLLSILLKLKKVPTAIIHHHYLYKEFSGIKRKIYHFAENAFMKSATHVVTPSPYIKDLIKEEIGKDALLLPIPFKRPEIKSRGTANVGQLLYIGTIEKRKGLDLLMEALGKCKNPGAYQLHFVGKTREPRYKDFLDEQIKEYGLNITFHGFLTDEELQDIISTSDVFVFPSLLEGFGMAINEVKFYGLPVVCFDNSAMPYSTTNGEDGYVVKDKDTSEFGKAIDRIVSDRELRTKMSENALKKAQSLYDQESFEQDSFTIFSNLLDLGKE